MTSSEKPAANYSPGWLGVNNALRGPWGRWMLASFTAFAAGLLWHCAIGFPSFGWDDWRLAPGGHPVKSEPLLLGISFAAMLVCIGSGIACNVLYWIGADRVPDNPRPKTYVTAFFAIGTGVIVASLAIAFVRM